ncbi:ubiquinol-cytochrome C chaperone family protein [Asticcacaulis sp. 201]|uniref:ubiquinol-cytochrome C chaperone family protein n=1 Tax=Asticcacaulis sp. 201 TaxID=3028787 RepID=UPI0029162F5A|nr:ubiquinol-cytochrome C chaperone family protein [Asticcacaulis sp. 201]MDV6329286.1 ubiquinol-cytochrome C chaperone family protein [Asticcacaulis sp. 201]
MQPLLDKLKSVFKPRPVKLIGDRLYAACVTQARLPIFYIDYGIDDAIGARFELLTFHVGLVVTRLKSLPADDPRTEQARDTAQYLFDAFLLALDSTLREQGVGDLAVPKRMKKLGLVIYTRMKRWDDLWRDAAGLGAEADYAARTIFAGSDYSGETDGEGTQDAISAAVLERAQAFAIYAQNAYDAFRVDDALAGRISWPAPAALEIAEDSAETIMTSGDA